MSQLVLAVKLAIWGEVLEMLLENMISYSLMILDNILIDTLIIRHFAFRCLLICGDAYCIVTLGCKTKDRQRSHY